jgi:hypothetical protein
MTPVSYSELIDALATSGIKTVLRRHFKEDSCINSTRVLLEVFRGYGLAASPFAVRALIFSKGFVDRVAREGYIPQGDAEVRQWCAQPGVYSVGIGFGVPGMPPDRWPGHLVLRAGKHYLLDATISQASRPARGIRMPEMAFLDSVPLEFWRGQGVAISESPDGSMIRYEPDPSNTSYLTSPAWRLRPDREECAFIEILEVLRTNGGLPAARRLREGAA